MDSLSTEEETATVPQVDDKIDANDHVSTIDSSGARFKAELTKWLNALKNILPIYISVHLAFFVITCLAALFVIPDFSWKAFPIDTLWQSWNRWDSLHYSYLATHGYTDWWRTVFFPLFPLLERALAVITHDPFIAGLIIANVT